MQDIFPKKYYLLRKKQLEFSVKHSINENHLTAHELLKKRLQKYKVSSFWGSFIKNGVRPTNVYFYVLKTFRLFLGLSVSFFIRMAFELLRPVVYLKPRRFGALIHLIPRLITIKQGFNLAKRFLIKSIRRRRELRLEDRIMSELVDVFSFKSRAFRHKKRVYAEVIENRVFLRRRRGKKSF